MQNITARLQRWIHNFPVTFSLVLICVLVWLVEATLGQSFVIAGVFSPSVALSQPWRFLTSIFMHDWNTPLHLFFNMFALVCCGPIFEKIFGAAKYVTLFVVCGVFGNVALMIWHLVTHTGNLSISLGASGGVFGLFGGLIILYKRLGTSANGILMTVGINLLISFYLTSIAWQAHIGGLIAGIGLTYLFLQSNHRIWSPPSY